MATKELVGPLPTVAFRGGPENRGWPPNPNPPKVAYVPPVNTCDPRYAACTEHHVACDCREAEFAEESAERRAERRETQQAFETILAGHATWQWSPARVAWRLAQVYRNTVGDLTLAELHAAQEAWRAGWAVEFQDYLRTKAKPPQTDAVVDGSWPVRRLAA